MASNAIYAVVTLLSFLSMESVFALDCYVADLSKLPQVTDLSNITFTISDCVEFLTESAKLLGQTVTIDPNVELICYTLNLELTDGQSGKMKGCSAKGGCKLTQTTIELLLNQGGVKVKNSSCRECSGNTCNFGTRFAVPSLLLFLLGAFLTRL